MNVGLFGNYLRNKDGNSRNLKKLLLDMIFVFFLNMWLLPVIIIKGMFTRDICL